MFGQTQMETLNINLHVKGIPTIHIPHPSTELCCVDIACMHVDIPRALTRDLLKSIERDIRTNKLETRNTYVHFSVVIG